jgi:hypothetical protein
MIAIKIRSFFSSVVNLKGFSPNNAKPFGAFPKAYHKA